MAIMTGRYSNKELRNDGYYPVGISVGKPRFSTGYEIREQCYALAPRYDMLKLGYEEYKAEYFKKLDKSSGLTPRLRRRTRSWFCSALRTSVSLRTGATARCLRSGGWPTPARSSRRCLRLTL